MLTRGLGLIAAATALVSFADPANAQQNYRCVDPRAVPPGTYPTCGYGPGQYRPQPYTLRDGRPVRTPGSWYAPSGPDQRYWNQYDAESRTYGPRELNPYDERGRLDFERTLQHLGQTRVRPWIERRRSEYSRRQRDRRR